jgi:hypothetical protein
MKWAPLKMEKAGITNLAHRSAAKRAASDSRIR